VRRNVDNLRQPLTPFTKIAFDDPRARRRPAMDNQAKFGCAFHTKLWPDLKMMVNAVIVTVQQ
jgi:hypothetical protein